MKRLKSVGNFFTRIACYVVGWNYNILQECGEASHRTLKQYASSITILLILWSTVGFFFADRYLDCKSFYSKAIVIFAFDLIIINVERFIILKNGKLEGLTKAFRIFLALLMAFLGSFIIDQAIFKNDITVKLHNLRATQLKELIALRDSSLHSDIKELKLTMDSLSRVNYDLYVEYKKSPVREYVASSETSKTGISVLNTTKIKSGTIVNPVKYQIDNNNDLLDSYKNELTKLKEKRRLSEKETTKEFSKTKPGILVELNLLFSIVLSSCISIIFYLILFFFLLMLELLVLTNRSTSLCDYDLVVEHQLRMKQSMLEKTEKKLLNIDEGNKTNN